MQIVVWVLAAVVLLGIAALLASVIDRRAGWNQIPLELDSSRDPDEYAVEVPGAARAEASAPLGEAGRVAGADASSCPASSACAGSIPSREMVMLVAMWVVGALLLVSLINLNGQADRARQREVVIAQMRQASVSAPWVAFNGVGRVAGRGAPPARRPDAVAARVGGQAARARRHAGVGRESTATSTAR